MIKWSKTRVNMADGLLGWPGFGPGGSLEFELNQLFTGDVWIAPRSGWYLVTISGGGGSGSGNGDPVNGGASGGGLLNAPVWIPQGVGGVANIGIGGVSVADGNGVAGSNTTLGNSLLVATGGDGGLVNTDSEAACGTIYGSLLTNSGRIYKSIGSNGQSDWSIGGVNRKLGGRGGNGVIETDHTFIDGIITGKYSVGGICYAYSQNGTPGQLYGAGGGATRNVNVGRLSGAGAEGCLFISWTGILSPATIL